MAEYLQEMGVNQAVARGLAVIAHQNPADPVAALGAYLLQLATTLERDAQVRPAAALSAPTASQVGPSYFAARWERVAQRPA